MPTQDTNAHIEQRIEDFVQELSGLIRSAALEAVETALGDRTPTQRAPRGGAKASSPATPSRKKATRKKASGGSRIRRSEEEIAALGEQFLEHVQSNPGQRLEEVGAAMGVPTSELKRPVSNLMDAKALRTEGQKRGTKYFASKRGGKK